MLEMTHTQSQWCVMGHERGDGGRRVSEECRTNSAYREKEVFPKGCERAFRQKELSKQRPRN